MSTIDFVTRARTVATIAASLRAELDALIEVYNARDYAVGGATAIVDGETGGKVSAADVHALLVTDGPAIRTALNAAKRTLNRMRGDL